MRVLCHGQPKLREDAPDVLLDGSFRDDKSGRDAFVRVSLRHQTEDLALAAR